jgi:antitoxin MazE
MKTTISRWGNSLALRLPRHLLEEARLSEGVCVNIELKDGAIWITPTRKKFNLAELLKGEPSA